MVDVEKLDEIDVGGRVCWERRREDFIDSTSDTLYSKFREAVDISHLLEQTEHNFADFSTSAISTSGYPTEKKISIHESSLIKFLKKNNICNIHTDTNQNLGFFAKKTELYDFLSHPDSLQCLVKSQEKHGWKSTPLNQEDISYMYAELSKKYDYKDCEEVISELIDYSMENLLHDTQEDHNGIFTFVTPGYLRYAVFIGTFKLAYKNSIITHYLEKKREMEEKEQDPVKEEEEATSE